MHPIKALVNDSSMQSLLEVCLRMSPGPRAQVIAEKLLDFLRTASDDGQKAEVAKRIGELAERFAPDTQWFIDTMNQASSPCQSGLVLPAI